MSVKITYFVHGTSTDNEDGISSGWKDADLSELGVKQAKGLSTQNTDNFDIVFCSDLTRAVHSANLAFKDRFRVQPDSRLRECNYGDYNGGKTADVEPLQEKMVTERFPNGESYEDVKARLASFLEDLKKNYDGKHVAIVAHKAPQLALDVLLKGMTWQEAFAGDWRKSDRWQPGWLYSLD